MCSHSEGMVIGVAACIVLPTLEVSFGYIENASLLFDDPCYGYPTAEHPT